MVRNTRRRRVQWADTEDESEASESLAHALSGFLEQWSNRQVASRPPQRRKTRWLNIYLIGPRSLHENIRVPLRPLVRKTWNPRKKLGKGLVHPPNLIELSNRRSRRKRARVLPFTLNLRNGMETPNCAFYGMSIPPLKKVPPSQVICWLRSSNFMGSPRL